MTKKPKFVTFIQEWSGVVSLVLLPIVSTYLNQKNSSDTIEKEMMLKSLEILMGASKDDIYDINQRKELASISSALLNKMMARTGVDQKINLQLVQSRLPRGLDNVLYSKYNFYKNGSINSSGTAQWRVEFEHGLPVVMFSSNYVFENCQMEVAFRKNNDNNFPASVIVGFVFNGESCGNVEDVSPIRARYSDSDFSSSTSGITASLGRNMFVEATTNVPEEKEKDRDLIISRNIIEFDINSKNIGKYKFSIERPEKVTEHFRKIF